jgi:hypothetical protein
MTTGLWRVTAILQHGWSCTNIIEDLGRGNAAVCEMCEVRHTRFVHTMEHADYPFAGLRCGCICAGRMEQNAPAASNGNAGL